MTKETKTERDERMTKEAQESMPENAKMMRRNGEAKIRVTFGRQTEGPKSWALVHVFQKGSPHPKGIDAVIIDSRVETGSGISRDMNQAICDDAINFVRGQITQFSCEEMMEKEEGKPETSKAETSSDGSGSELATGSAESNQSASAGAPATDAQGTVYEECTTEECKAAEKAGDSPAPSAV